MDFIQELERFWRKHGFRRIQYESRILWLREEERDIALVDIVPQPLPGQPVRTVKQLESEMTLLERNLMIRSQKKVNRLTLMLCDDLPDQKELQETADYPDIWWLDWKHARILIFEKQKTDFFGLRRELEDFAVTYQDKSKQDNRRELGKIFQPVTLAIISVNVIVFFVLSMIGDTEDSAFMAGHGAMSWEAITQGREYYRLITAMFLHFGMEHLLQNMLILLLVGSRLEKAMGKIRYFVVYIGSGMAASAASVFFTLQGSYDIAAGASGAIFGVMGGMACLLIKDTISKKRRYIPEIGLAGVLFMVVCAASYGFFETGVDNAAHIGGLIGGLILTGIVTILPKKKTGQKTGFQKERRV